MTHKRVLIACEASGIVRRAFARLGHDAWSCDLRPAEDGSNKHIVGDVRTVLNDGWDMLMVAHPPCTRLCNSGVRWLHEPPKRLEASHYSAADRAAYATMDRDERLAFMWRKLHEGAALFSACWNAPIPEVAVENPVMHKHAKALIENYQDAAQTTQPWHHGDPFFKGIGLYLRNLPKLTDTNRLTPPKPGTPEHREWSQIHMATPGAERWRIRSTFFPGIAAAMAEQWGGDPDGIARLAA